MTTTPKKGEPFFYYFSGIILITVIIAFGLNILLQRYHVSSAMPLILIHGISMLLWYFLFFWQTRLIRKGNPRVHKKLGLLSIILSVSIVISGVMVAIANYRGEGEALTILGNFLGMFLFAIFYGFALINRFRAAVHKRLMLIASIAMLSPALVRIIRLIEINEFITGPVWIIFMLVLPIYEYRKEKKIHKTTLIATGILLLSLFISIPIGFSEGWSNLMQSIFG